MQIFRAVVMALFLVPVAALASSHGDNGSYLPLGDPAAGGIVRMDGQRSVAFHCQKGSAKKELVLLAGDSEGASVLDRAPLDDVDTDQFSGGTGLKKIGDHWYALCKQLLSARSASFQLFHVNGNKLERVLPLWDSVHFVNISDQGEIEIENVQSPSRFFRLSAGTLSFDKEKTKDAYRAYFKKNGIPELSREALIASGVKDLKYYGLLLDIDGKEIASKVIGDLGGRGPAAQNLLERAYILNGEADKAEKMAVFSGAKPKGLPEKFWLERQKFQDAQVKRGLAFEYLQEGDLANAKRLYDEIGDEQGSRRAGDEILRKKGAAQ